MSIGFVADAWDFATDKVEDVWDATGARVVDAADSAIRSLPGGNELIEAAGDFARSPAGMITLRAFSTMLFGSVAWAIGPQLAAVTFAVPGIMRGERFDEAWLTEFKWRVEKTAEILGPGIVDAFGTQLSDTLRKMMEQFGVGALVEMGVQEFAKRYDIREDVAAFAMALWNRVQLPPRDAFDPTTGRQLKPWAASAAATAQASALDASRHRALFGAREHRVVYGAREHALFYADRERAVMRSSAPSSATSSSLGTAAIVAVGVGALVAWRLRLL